MFNKIIIVNLSDVGERLLLPPQSDDDGIGDDGLRKVHHRGVVRGAEQHHLARLGQVSVNAHRLVLKLKK